MKWYALAMIIVGVLLIAPSPSRVGEFGLPLYALLGWTLFLSGCASMLVLVFGAL